MKRKVAKTKAFYLTVPEPIPTSFVGPVILTEISRVADICHLKVIGQMILLSGLEKNH